MGGVGENDQSQALKCKNATLKATNHLEYQIGGMVMRRASILNLVAGVMLLATAGGTLALPSPPPLQQCYERCTDTIVAQLFPELEAAGTRRVAILSFRTSDGSSSSLGDLLAGELRSRFASRKSRIKVVERKDLPQAVEEQDLLGTGIMDSETASRTGKVLGADTLIRGIVTLTREVVQVDVHAFSATTSQVISSVLIRFEGKDEDPPRIQPLLNNLGEADTPDRKPPKAKTQDSWSAGHLRIEALTVLRPLDRKEATVPMNFVNTSNTDLILGIKKGGFGVCNLYLLDENGAQHRALGDGRGTGTLNCVTKTSKKEDFTTLPSGSTVFAMTFKAEKERRIEGERFNLNISLVFLEGEKRVNRTVSLKNLELDHQNAH